MVIQFVWQEQYGSVSGSTYGIRGSVDVGRPRWNGRGSAWAGGFYVALLKERKIMGIQEYIRYHSKNVSLKHYESLADWEELTAKNFIFFRINIAPTLPPDVTPSTVTAQPPLAITDPLSDWKKGVKRDMSIFRELKKVKEWEQWDTQFRADVATQGVSRVLDRNFQPQTYDDKVLFHEQQQYLYAVFIRIL